jgi:hypothetical protein
MAWTKQQLIEQAFGELALAHFVFDLDADTLESALCVLDTMMAEWLELGIDVGYLLPFTPEDSNIGDDSGIPLSAGATVWSNLAVRLAAGRGKSLTAQTIATATTGYNRLLGVAVKPVGQASSLSLAGAGNKSWRGR